MSLLVRGLSGQTLVLNHDVFDLNNDGLLPVAELKRVLEEREGVPSDQLRLLAGTRALVDDGCLTTEEVRSATISDAELLTLRRYFFAGRGAADAADVAAPRRWERGFRFDASSDR